MTKKYKLLINNSPEFPPNTIATEVDTDGVKTYVVQYHNGSRFLHASSVENRHTIWHEITEPEPKQSFKRWRAEIGGGYWYISGYGDIFLYTEQNNDRSDYRYLTGNYFQTREEAESYKARQEAIGRVTHAIIEANEDKVGVFAIVWRNSAYDTLYIDHLDGTIIQQVIPTAVSKEIALSIISSHKEDLDLIFNLK